MTRLIQEAQIPISKRTTYNVHRVDAPWDKSLQTLARKDLGPANVWEIAYLRPKVSRDHDLNQYGSFTRHGLARFAEETPLLVIQSPLLNPELATQAVEANRQGNYFTQPQEVYEKLAEIAEKDKDKKPTQRRVLFLPHNTPFKISPHENQEIFQASFKQHGQKYLDFTQQDDIAFYQVSPENAKNKDNAIFTQLWFAGLDGRSYLFGFSYDLCYVNGVRGVSKSGEATRAEISPSEAKKTENTIETYTPRQIKKATKNLVLPGDIKITGLENLILEGLRKAKK